MFKEYFFFWFVSLELLHDRHVEVALLDFHAGGGYEARNVSLFQVMDQSGTKNCGTHVQKRVFYNLLAQRCPTRQQYCNIIKLPNTLVQ